MQDYAATAQLVLEETVAAEVLSFARPLQEAEGLVLGGGVAANVRLATALQRRLGKRTHVPFTPGDAGLPVGAAWAVAPPTARQAGLPYLGLPVQGTGTLRRVAGQCGARQVGVEEVAGLLCNGTIVGVVWGPQGVGGALPASSAGMRAL